MPSFLCVHAANHSLTMWMIIPFPVSISHIYFDWDLWHTHYAWPSCAVVLWTVHQSLYTCTIEPGGSMTLVEVWGVIIFWPMRAKKYYLHGLLQPITWLARTHRRKNDIMTASVLCTAAVKATQHMQSELLCKKQITPTLVTPPTPMSSHRNQPSKDATQYPWSDPILQNSDSYCLIWTNLNSYNISMLPTWALIPMTPMNSYELLWYFLLDWVTYSS